MKKAIVTVVSIALVGSSMVLGSSTQTAQNLAYQKEQGAQGLMQYKQLEPSYISSFAEYFFQLSPQDQNTVKTLLLNLADENNKNGMAINEKITEKANFRESSSKDSYVENIWFYYNEGVFDGGLYNVACIAQKNSDIVKYHDIIIKEDKDAAQKGVRIYFREGVKIGSLGRFKDISYDN